MKLGGQRDSANVEDRRGIGMGGGVGIGTIAIAVIAYFLGFDPSAVLNTAQQMSPPQQAAPADPNKPKDEGRLFVGKVLASTEDAWGEIFRRAGSEYRKPTLVLFSGQVQSACGRAGASTGPFYCPGDEKLYIDLQFYEVMKQRFKAPGDFAQAYVIAHEVGHHIQKVTGVMGKIDAMRGRVDQAEFNRNMVKLELQADCYAGVWGHYANAFKGIVEPGDIDEALGAAAAIGDDRLQQQSKGRVVPESFTHGTSKQRVTWFKRGMESGDPKTCDTFSAREL